MVSRILKEVKSPFTNEFIKDLIEKYITCNCNDNLFYTKINEIEDMDVSIDPHTIKLINQIHSQGIPMNELWNCKDDIQLIYDSNKSWEVLYSKEDPMGDNEPTLDNRAPLIYRIYLNLKDKEKAEFVENYIKKFQKSNIPFELKFSKDNSRLDQVVILSRSENLEENVLAIEELTKDYELGKIPLLVGEYKDNIGISEEYYNRLYSPTKVKLALVRSSIKKYLCDHAGELKDKLSDSEKEVINEYLDEFNYLYENEKEDIEILGGEYESLNKSYYQEKEPIDCAKEHIENDHDSYFCGSGLLDLNSLINQIYSNSKEQFTNEIVHNYRMIGTQVWGFSQSLVFSNETEKLMVNQKENEIILSSEQIGSNLKNISRKGLIDEVQEELISIVEEKYKAKEDNSK